MEPFGSSSSAVFWLVILAFCTWGISGTLQWWIIRHQEKILADLQQLQLQLRASSEAARGAAPHIDEARFPRAPFKCKEPPLAG
jgi:hypothetical protein